MLMPAPKNFRLNGELREWFERHCRENLLDERAVVEAWLLRSLETTPEERQAVAKRYSDWLEERERPSGDKPSARNARKKKS
jgi:hypothetical protein